MISFLARTQAPDDELVYELTLTQFIALIAPLTIASIAWSVVTPAGDGSPLQIHAQSNAPDFSYTRVRVSEGTPGNRYSVRATLTMSDGQREHIVLLLPIGYVEA